MEVKNLTFSFDEAIWPDVFVKRTSALPGASLTKFIFNFSMYSRASF